ncbi:3662_t:CDS:2, partial [Gigaspora rosea]
HFSGEQDRESNIAFQALNIATPKIITLKYYRVRGFMENCQSLSFDDIEDLTDGTKKM